MAFADVTSETFAFTCILFDLECARGIDNVPHGFLVGDCKAVDLFFLYSWRLIGRFFGHVLQEWTIYANVESDMRRTICSNDQPPVAEIGRWKRVLKCILQ